MPESWGPAETDITFICKYIIENSDQTAAIRDVIESHLAIQRSDYLFEGIKD